MCFKIFQHSIFYFDANTFPFIENEYWLQILLIGLLDDLIISVCLALPKTHVTVEVGGRKAHKNTERTHTNASGSPELNLNPELLGCEVLL